MQAGVIVIIVKPAEQSLLQNCTVVLYPVIPMHV
jgi:hypothetical protein